MCFYLVSCWCSHDNECGLVSNLCQRKGVKHMSASFCICSSNHGESWKRLSIFLLVTMVYAKCPNPMTTCSICIHVKPKGLCSHLLEAKVFMPCHAKPKAYTMIHVKACLPTRVNVKPGSSLEPNDLVFSCYSLQWPHRCMTQRFKTWSIKGLILWWPWCITSSVQSWIQW